MGFPKERKGLDHPYCMFFNKPKITIVKVKLVHGCGASDTGLSLGLGEAAPCAVL